MKFYVLVVLFFGGVTVFALRMLSCSWPLSLIGGLLAISGLAIFFLGCNVQRLLSSKGEAEGDEPEVRIGRSK